MGARQIVTLPDPILRTRAQKVRSVTADLQHLIDDMIETMRAAPGVGLAAPQVGVGRRVITVEYAEPSEDPQAPPKDPRLYVVVNPEIIRHSTETVEGNEGCLSVPGYAGRLERFESVTVKGLNRRGGPFRLKASGWLARIFQHEIDHLDGVLFIDRASEVWQADEKEAAQAEAPASR
jgi:peptide deformylase